MRAVVVVGGGASGTLAAAELLRREIPVVLVEPRARPGVGVAYATESAVHRLNVRAGRMSGRADDPGHFLRWLREREPAAAEGTFAARRDYRVYLHDLLEEARGASQGTAFEHVQDRAVQIRRTEDGFRVALSSGRMLAADEVVIALGNLTPGFRPALPSGLDPRRIVADPWAPGAFDGFRRADRVLLIGTGLTAVDVALGLDAQGHRGSIVAVSRRGLLPRAQASVQPPLAPQAAPPALRGVGRLRTLTRAVRQEIARLLASGGDWHDVFEALRPATPALWNSLPPADRRRFVRHLQPWWDAHRHRMPPSVARTIAGMLGDGRLVVRAARVLRVSASLQGMAVTLLPRGGAASETCRVSRVVNCTGAGPIAETTHPLLAELIASGLVRPDGLGLGLEARPDGGLVDRDGAVVPGLSALGPILKGVLWETTSIPEIRLQARALAERVSAARAGTSGRAARNTMRAWRHRA